MATVTTYQELQDTLQSIIDTSDPEVTALIPYAIQQVEHRLNGDPDFRVSMMAQTWEVTTDQEYFNLPPDMLSIRRVSTTYNGEDYSLQYVTPEQAIDYTTSSNSPIWAYSIVSDWFQLIPPPSGEYVIRVEYWKGIDRLDITQTDNWLLTEYSHIYIAGALAELYLIMFEEDRAALHQQRFTDFVSKLKSADNIKRYSGNSLRIRVS